LRRELNFSTPSASDLTPIFNVALDNFHRPKLVTSLKLCDNTSPTEKLVEEFHLTELNQRVPNSTWYRYGNYLRWVGDNREKMHLTTNTPPPQKKKYILVYLGATDSLAADAGSKQDSST